MQTIDLNLPKNFEDTKKSGVEVRPAHLQKWLEQLPMANQDLVAEQLLEKIEQINHVRLLPENRFRLIQLFSSAVQASTDTLSERYASALLPLNPKQRARYELAISLNNQLALGFRIVIQDLIRLKSSSKKETKILFLSIYMAVRSLARVLLETYLVYSEEPRGIWGIINQLFQYAESHDGLQISLNESTGQPNQATIDFAIKRIQLLAIADPNHLMHQEVKAVYKLLRKLTIGCKIEAEMEPASEAGSFILDLHADASPRYIPTGEQLNTVEPRIINTQKLLIALRNKQEQLSQLKGKTHAIGEGLGIRLQIDMLARLCGSWGRNSGRQHQRETSLGSAHLTVGLSNCHHYIADGAKFQPELDEQYFFGHKNKTEADQWSLLPMDTDPWKVEDAELQFRSNTRASNFSNDEASDIWERIYLHKSRKKPKTASGQTEHNNEEQLLQKAMSWTYKNISQNGLCLICQPSNSLPIRVGELISFFPSNSTNKNAGWTIGTVRWLKVLEHTSLEIGIMVLSQSAQSVSVRAIRGTGKGGEYMRALLTMDTSNDTPEHTLIAPAAIYDTGSELLLNLDGQLQYIRLSDILVTTKSFSQFKFQELEIPDFLREQYQAQPSS